jgi:predicted RNA-binding protein with PIN domain
VVPRRRAPLPAGARLTVVLVDGRNVLRSRWPNIPEDELVRRTAAWAEAEGVDAVVAFDGSAPQVEVPVRVVATGGESADDWITREAARLAAEGTAYRLVTSDRELRKRAGGAAERVIGGGTFASLLPS